MVDIGRINTLTVKRTVDAGALLDGGAAGDILLPQKFVSRKMKPGDKLDCFVYIDREKRLVATLKKPLAITGQVARLQVVATSAAGAYLEWGLDHDLFVPNREQHAAMEKGESHVVFIFLDERTQRITASSKLDQFLGLLPPEYAAGTLVDLFICEQTDLGYKAVVDNATAAKCGFVVFDDFKGALDFHTDKRFKQMVRVMRHLSVQLLAIGHTPNDVPPVVRDNVTHALLFASSNADTIRELAGVYLAGDRRALAEAMRGLRGNAVFKVNVRRNTRAIHSAPPPNESGRTSLRVTSSLSGSSNWPGSRLPPANST